MVVLWYADDAMAFCSVFVVVGTEDKNSGEVALA